MWQAYRNKGAAAHTAVLMDDYASIHQHTGGWHPTRAAPGVPYCSANRYYLAAAAAFLCGMNVWGG